MCVVRFLEELMGYPLVHDHIRVEVSKSEVRLPMGVIREIGEYEIDIQLHSEVTQAVKVSVIAEA